MYEDAIIYNLYCSFLSSGKRSPFETSGIVILFIAMYFVLMLTHRNRVKAVSKVKKPMHRFLFTFFTLQYIQPYIRKEIKYIVNLMAFLMFSASLRVKCQMVGFKVTYLVTCISQTWLYRYFWEMWAGYIILNYLRDRNRVIWPK